MSKGIMDKDEELKRFYLDTDIADYSAAQAALKNVKENAFAPSKEKYVAALNYANPANIEKARKYYKLYEKGTIAKNFGFALMAVFAVLMAVIDSGFDDAITTWLSLGFWIGVGVQLYISLSLKDAWDKLTIQSTVIHSALRGATPVKTSSGTNVNAEEKTEEENYVYCSECGRQNKEGAKHCENCGKEL